MENAIQELETEWNKMKCSFRLEKKEVKSRTYKKQERTQSTAESVFDRGERIEKVKFSEWKDQSNREMQMEKKRYVNGRCERWMKKMRVRKEDFTKKIKKRKEKVREKVKRVDKW